MSDAELDVFELLVEVPDHDLYGWITGRLPVPDNYNTTMFQRLKDFSKDNPAFGDI